MPFVATEDVAALLRVKLAPTVVVAFPQLADGEHDGPGVGGELPPTGSTEA